LGLWCWLPRSALPAGFEDIGTSFSLHSGNVVDVILFALVAMANLSRRKKLVKQRAVVQKKKQKFRLVSSKSLNLSIEAAN
jgi:hypothetical protein